jgi:7,8-dihydroneopterin aldolase/epimerase/oxygenase
MTDRVTLRGIQGRGRHGVLASERAHGQVFLVDLVIGLDTRKAADSDDLDHTVDYSLLAERTVHLIEGEPVDLIETLAARIAEACLTEPVVDQVEVTVHKPQAPVAVPFADVSVTIVRDRGSLGRPLGESPEELA